MISPPDGVEEPHEGALYAMLCRQFGPGLTVAGLHLSRMSSEAEPHGVPRTYDSLGTVLGRPDVAEALARALCRHNGGEWATATEGGRDAFRIDARQLLDVAAREPRT